MGFYDYKAMCRMVYDGGSFVRIGVLADQKRPGPSTLFKLVSGLIHVLLRGISRCTTVVQEPSSILFLRLRR